MFPANRLSIRINVEYTAPNGQRVTKAFPNQWQARRFYIAQAIAGTQPKVLKG